jgi:hypothetical protein
MKTSPRRTFFLPEDALHKIASLPPGVAVDIPGSCWAPASVTRNSEKDGRREQRKAVLQYEGWKGRASDT